MPDTAPLSASSPGGLDLGTVGQLADAHLLRALAAGGRPFHRTGEQPGVVGDLADVVPADGVVLLDSLDDGSRTVVLQVAGSLVQLVSRRQLTTIQVVGSELPAVTALLAEMQAAVRAAREQPGDQVRMRLWAHRGNYAEMSTRPVEAPSWGEVADNYAGATAASLAPLMDLADLAARAGRLVLWHGVPGTGKTTAVRALSRAWSPWCETHYVADPEKLFADPGYLLEVAGVDGGDEDGDDHPWRLIVAEDCDEYLHADAKQRAGASLGRLLNLCDGILGHGLQVVVLLTTNEDVGRLHPAITRPGRCLGQTEFLPLSAGEAADWLGADTTAPTRPTTLAELYAVREQRQLARGRVDAEPGGYL
ncbi:hypothetical protein SAMN05660199_03215 [Klenkia soli]|uniref:Uncharacterized protein n=1 Tax=Klenkia soli TaxID=1052260 RepID=A0A1H0Q4Q8_9ACTN|nr:DUF5925 domain-containing protein [Klenkia soli]SDP12382.1 hypothetical protein SAMN05660199_03215 [Klenkia soli]